MYTSSDEEEALVMLAMEDDNSRKRRKWVHDINLERLKCGEYHTLMPQLRKDDKRCYIYFRMTIDCFDELLHLVENDIRKSDTNYREAISPEERLAITLRYLATGDTFYTIGHSFRVGFSTVSAIVVEVCEALCRNLQHIYLPEPTTEIWKKSEEGFRNTWRFPNCIGSIDGKHVTIKCPDKTGSNYWCYLNKFSTVLMAIVGPDYRFISVDIGGFGKNSDGGIFEASNMGRRFETNQMGVPEPITKVPNINGDLIWFNDGSKTAHGTGSGFFGQTCNYNKSYSVGQHRTVFHAEVFPLVACIDGIIGRNPKAKKINENQNLNSRNSAANPSRNSGNKVPTHEIKTGEKLQRCPQKRSKRQYNVYNMDAES
uniref:Protein ANTAGONIST OF LIKE HETEROCHROMATIN PROTEIN 1-like n=1 Tax=Diabrotica virgifera virgifera TaxID=50390 RepID=A0A6P7G6W6_DIAVI